MILQHPVDGVSGFVVPPPPQHLSYLYAAAAAAAPLILLSIELYFMGAAALTNELP